MQLFKVFCLFFVFGVLVLAQKSHHVTTDNSLLPTGITTDDASLMPTSTVTTSTSTTDPDNWGKPYFFFNWPSTRNIKWVTTTESEYSSTTSHGKYRKTVLSSSTLTFRLKEKHTRSIEASLPHHTKLPKHMKTLEARAVTRPHIPPIAYPTRASSVAIKPFPTLDRTRGIAARDIPDCFSICFDNAWSKTKCDKEDKECACVNEKFQEILYYCLNSLCDSEELPISAQCFVQECFAYLPTNEKGETILFQGFKTHHQEELDSLYARNNMGSGVGSGARPVGPTPFPGPRKVGGRANAEVVITTIVTEYLGEELYPSATEGLQKGEDSDGEKVHGHWHLHRARRHHI